MLISIAQIIISVLVIALVLLQDRSSGMSGLFGGGDTAGVYQKRRGIEKVIFILTIVLIAAFAGLSLANLFLQF